MTSSLHLKARLSDSALFLRLLTLGGLRKGMDAQPTPPGAWPYRTGWKPQKIGI
jgi:hypothetical protein